MQILNNSLLNILIPNDNKALKEVLKQADSKTIEQMINNKSVNINDVLKNLFDDLKTGNKSNTQLENILKNTNIFKDLGSFTTDLKNLLNELESNKENPTLQKFKPLLENLFKNIKDLDANNLKEQLSKTGVFLESKLATITTSSNTQTLAPALTKVLGELQNLLKNVDPQLTKQINETITKILNPVANQQTPNTQTNSIASQTEQLTNLKNLITNLQTLSNSLNSNNVNKLNEVTTQLQNILEKGTLIESKISNTQDISVPKESNQNLNSVKNELNTQTKELLNQVKTNLNQLPVPLAKEITTQIDNILKMPDLFAKNQTIIEPKTLINNLINSPELKNISTTNQNISNIVLNLQNLVENIETMENKVLNLQNISNDKNLIINNLKENLDFLKNELINNKSFDTTNLNQIISKLDNLQTLFTKIDVSNINLPQTLNNQFISNFTTNLNSLFLSLKELVTNLEPNENLLNFQNNLLKSVDKIETLMKEIISNPEILKNDKNPTNDMKSILLQLSDELSSKSDPKSQDILKQVDKLLTNIEYNQLNSLVSNSNNVYVPFFWEMLEEGTIKFKNQNEEKFYCQINLNLKDFGKLDMMLALYDKNKLDLTIQVQREHFKTEFKENIQKLKQALNSVDLIPVNIRLVDLKDETVVENKKENIYFNNDNSDFDMGLDIRA